MNSDDLLIPSGMDWMISSMNWRSRFQPERGNPFSVTVIVSEDVYHAAGKWTFLPEIKSVMSGCFQRRFPKWYPIWKRGTGTLDFAIADVKSPDAVLNEPLPAGQLFQLCRCRREHSCYLIFRFSHQLFDGVGAEKFIRHLLENSGVTAPAEPMPAAEWNIVREQGRKLRGYMKTLIPEKIAVVPPGKVCRTNFYRFTIEPEVFLNLKETVERQYGPFCFSMHVLAETVKCADHLLTSLNISQPEIMIPMSVDLRRQMKQNDSIFFNHWSILPLVVRRDSISVPEIRKLYYQGIADMIPEMFATASAFMRYLPFRVVNSFVNHSPQTTAGTMMFSYVKSDDMIPAEQIFHCPVLPDVCPLGIFANEFRNRVQIVTAIHHTAIPQENADTFLNDLKNALFSGI